MSLHRCLPLAILLLLSAMPATAPATAAPLLPKQVMEDALEAALRCVALGRLREGRSLFLHLAETAGAVRQPAVEQFALLEAARLSLQLQAPADALRIWETAYARHSREAITTTICTETKKLLQNHPDLQTSLRQHCLPQSAPAPTLSMLPDEVAAQPDGFPHLPLAEPVAPTGDIRLLLASGKAVSFSLIRDVAAQWGEEHVLLPPGEWTLQERAGLIHCLPGDGAGANLDSVTMGSVAMGSDLRLDIPARVLRFQGQRYTGTVRVLARPGSLHLILHVPLEDYVEGVLLGEMPASWPLEALKAQAVAARTYALANLRHASLDWDLRDDARDQRYLPPGPATQGLEQIRAAVQATRGLVLTHAGRLFPAYYHAHSGGRLEGASQSMPGPAAVLRPGVEPAGAELPLLEWTFSLPAGRVLEAAGCSGGSGKPLTVLRSMAVASRSAGGRVATFRLDTNNGPCTADATALKRALGTAAFKSLLCEVQVDDSTVYFSGTGHGHGVGMSQYGAARLAGQGLAFDAILTRYYHEVALARLP